MEKSDNIDLRRRGNDLLNPKQTNFRIDCTDADEFRQFCKTNALSQAEGFHHLLCLLAANESVAIAESLKSRGALKKEVAILKHALHQVTEKKKELVRKLKHTMRAQELMVRVRMGLECCGLFSHAVCKLPLRKSGDTSDRVLSKAEGERRGSYTYQYPSRGRLEVLTLDFLCYDGKAVLCHFCTQSGEKLKARMWPKTGFHPFSSSLTFVGGEYAVTGKKWLCSFGQMLNGYVELVCAIPVSGWFALPPKDTGEAILTREAQGHMSLEGQIAEADGKKEK